MAGIFDAIQAGNWQRTGDKTKPKPKPIERPSERASKLRTLERLGEQRKARDGGKRD